MNCYFHEEKQALENAKIVVSFCVKGVHQSTNHTCYVIPVLRGEG